VSVGDDAAVVDPDGRLQVVSTDMMVEGTHFRLSAGWATPRDVGRRAVAAALSDLAAMGVPAGEIYVALGLPPQLGGAGARELIAGVIDAADSAGAALAGGDIVRASQVTVAVTCVGWADPRTPPVTRSRAMPGDRVAVTGALGGPAAAVALLERGEDPGTLGVRLRDPQPRLAAGIAAARAGASAMIDLSDGVATDAAHVARASGVELVIDIGRLPLLDGVEQAATRLGESARALAAASGEEFELLVCAPPTHARQLAAAVQEAGTPLTWIGEVHAGEARARLIDDGREAHAARPFEHFG
jgi:thiamine-monophosphate kinase